MALDQFTQLRQMGYSGTLNEMQVKYFSDVTGLDTIGEQLYKALSQAMARDILGITTGGGPVVAVPSELGAVGTPNSQTFLRGDGRWETPPGLTPQQITDLNTALTQSTTALAQSSQALQLASDAATQASNALILANNLANQVATLSNQVASMSAILSGKADKSKTVQAVLQVGSTYPTPIETGYAKIEYNGNLDPNLVPGISMTDFDDWTASG